MLHMLQISRRAALSQAWCFVWLVEPLLTKGVVDTAKLAKYLRSVLTELGIDQAEATPLYVDNMAAIAMVNENKPTTRSRHIDIQHFDVQEWRQRNIIVLHHIPGVINCSDAGTKALGWTLHSQHVHHSLGHYGMP